MSLLNGKINGGLKALIISTFFPAPVSLFQKLENFRGPAVSSESRICASLMSCSRLTCCHVCLPYTSRAVELGVIATDFYFFKLLPFTSPLLTHQLGNPDLVLLTVTLAKCVRT